MKERRPGRRTREPADTKAGLHPRNRHRERYDFPRLIAASPELGRFVRRNEHGDESVDFADPRAVKALNRAILEAFYGVVGWDIPEGYLCPPIPGRADYLHYAADLLAETSEDSEIPKNARILDIGTGANLVYPLIGQHEYGWSFVGSDVDETALRSAQAILDQNPAIAASVELRHQGLRGRILEGIIRPGERFDLMICNPPFHASAEEARAGSLRKWRNLGRDPGARAAPKLNFGGMGSELWTPGGERAFILEMIEESARFGDQCGWFTTLVSKEELLPVLGQELERVDARDRRIQDMAQGQKRSRIIAWTFKA